MERHGRQVSELREKQSAERGGALVAEVEWSRLDGPQQEFAGQRRHGDDPHDRCERVERAVDVEGPDRGAPRRGQLDPAVVADTQCAVGWQCPRVVFGGGPDDTRQGVDHLLPTGLRRHRDDPRRVGDGVAAHEGVGLAHTRHYGPEYRQHVKSGVVRMAEMSNTPATANLHHFAVNADDLEGSRRFYESVFGWTFTAWGPPGFYQIRTGTDAAPGVQGAMQERRELLDRPTNGFECTFAVDDVDATANAVVGSGGRIVMERFTITGVGHLIAFEDPSGNAVMAMQYDDNA